MNNSSLKKLSIVLCFIFCFTFFFGCNNSTPPPQKEDEQETLPTLPEDNEENEEVEYEYVLFGSYPNSKETNEQTILALSSLIGNLPSAYNFNGWTDYEYYILGKKESFAFYKDVSLSGQKYRAVFFNEYRPEQSNLESTALNSYQDDNGYQINQVHYFKYEPIKWRVLEEKNGEKLLLSEYIISSMAFQPALHQCVNTALGEQSGFYYANHDVAPIATYANSYEHSEVRKFLNQNFYGDAFSALEKQYVILSTIKNDSQSTGQPLNDFTGRDTEDYVYLPSFVEIVNHDYGFETSGKEDALRKQAYTDYSLCQGAYSDVDGGYRWWLRSASFFINKYSRMAQAITNVGKVHNYHYVNQTIMGVVPMMKILAE